MTQGNGEQHSVRTNGVALREIAQRNVEWYSVHRISIVLREIAQRGVEWYSVHANGVALREMALRNVQFTAYTQMVQSSCEINWLNQNYTKILECDWLSPAGFEY